MEQCILLILVKQIIDRLVQVTFKPAMTYSLCGMLDTVRLRYMKSVYEIHAKKVTMILSSMGVSKFDLHIKTFIM